MLARTPASTAHAALDAPPAEPLATLGAIPAVASAVGAELRDFAAERLKAHGERIRAWSKVRSPVEFADVEMRFAVETMGIYADEALHLQDIARAAFEIAVSGARA